jgi:hypothetical protein
MHKGASGMNMYDSMFSPSYVLNEQVARQVFDTLPERGPIVVIMDKNGNCWPSDLEEFSKLRISEPFLKELCAKIDDGAEPVVTQASEASIVAAQLATERTDCGYVFIALPRYSPESTLVNIDIIEALLNQIALVARLLENNTLLHELQMKHYRTYGNNEASSN